MAQLLFFWSKVDGRFVAAEIWRSKAKAERASASRYGEECYATEKIEHERRDGGAGRADRGSGD